MLFAAPWMPRVRILPVTLVAMSVLLAACGSGSADPSPTPTPGPYTAPPGTPTPVVAPPDTPYRLVFREYGNTEDIVWRIVPGDPSQREKLATIQHREGYGIVASLSPDGRMLAYLTLPEQALNEQSSQADVYVLDLKTNSNRLVTGGVDYQFRPLWSPDGQLLFLRRLAGAEVLSADVSIIYTKIVREPLEGEPTPTPTPRPTPTPTPLPPDQTPTPTPVPEDPIKTILKARYSQVMSFIPIGWADDNRSLYFVQVNGGTQGTTVVGAYFPATAESIAAEATPTPAPETPAPTPDPALPPPPPPPPPTPTPTPKPTSKFVMQLTEAAASDFILSGDMHKVAFASSSLVEGEFVNQVFIADLITSAITPIQEDGLPAGDRLGPVWHPDNNHITVGVLPFGGHAGGAVIVPLQLAQPQFLATSVSGYDIPRAWSPDATYLAVTNWSGPDLANSGDPSLDLVSPNGFRVRIGQGAGYAKTDAVIGWMVPS